METRICKTCGMELPIEQFQKNLHGYTSVCLHCANEKRRKTRLERKMKNVEERFDEIAKAKAMRLQDFTPRELMQELVRRGYEFEITYTEVHKINSKDF